MKPGIIIAFVGTGGLLFGCIAGVAIGSGGSSDPKVIVTPSPYKVVETVAAPAPSAAPTVAATSAAPTKAAPVTFDDGVWIVGEDFPAGTYRTTETVSGCYWAIYKSGTNGSDIIENDIVSGGRPTVTLKRGQDFKSQDCGTWVKR